MDKNENKEKKESKKEIDWDKVMKESDALLEKYARLEEQHDQWNREYHDDDESLRIADEFAEKIGLRVVEISEKEEDKKRK